MDGNAFVAWARSGEAISYFVTWKGDHSPRHVHVYRDGKLVLKWNLDAQLPMAGKTSARVLEIIAELEKEGAL
jgi:hypothetical protein